MSWDAINLAAPEFATPPEPPAWCGLIYRGKRHKISGPPEAAKTLLAWVIALDALRDGANIAAIDFETGPEATRLLLTELGFTLEEIAALHYFEPDREPTDEQTAYFIENRIDLVVIDAVAGAYEASGLDDNKRNDVERWQLAWTRPLYRAGIATLLIDHVVKNADARGDFSIGSERKAGTVDVHIGLEVVKKIARGTTGLYKAHIRKDRPAFLRSGGTREIELHSAPETHAISWAIRETGMVADDGDHWQPTVLMQKVSRYLEQQPDPVSRNQIENGVGGKSRKHLRQAIDELIADGYATETNGARGARMVTSLKPFTTSPDFAPTSPGEVAATSPDLARPLQGGEVVGEDALEQLLLNEEAA